jgi:hypothetical protein
MTVDEQVIDGGPWTCDDAGTCKRLLFRMYWQPVDEAGNVVENEWEHSQARARREAIAKPKQTEKRPEVKIEQVEEAHAAPAHETRAQVPDAPAAAPVAQIAVPSPATAAHEVAGLMPAGGAANGITVVLAAIAVLGGGAGWKFYSQWAKQKHEERMAEIERGARVDDDGKKRCEGHAQESRVAVANVDAKVEALTQRIASLEARNSDTAAISFGENVEDRLVKIEKALKAAKRRATTAR